MNLVSLSNIAIQAATTAGKVIRQHMNDDLIVEKKDGITSRASQVLTVVDRASEEIIRSHLSSSCKEYSLAILTEETEDDGSRFKEEYFWCVDPMDGTLAYINKQPGYSVSIALVAIDGTPIIGVVYDPYTETLYYALKGNGAFKNHQPWEINHKNDHLSYVTDRGLMDSPHSTEIIKSINETKEKLSLSKVKEISGAGAVMNAIRVLENGPAYMFKFPKKENGGGSVWDFAATACIYNELGLPATNFAGGKLDLNRKDNTFMNHEGVYFSNLLAKD